MDQKEVTVKMMNVESGQAVPNTIANKDGQIVDVLKTLKDVCEFCNRLRVEIDIAHEHIKKLEGGK
jgi:hypothetical protein